jgi:hypothetical protein
MPAIRVKLPDVAIIEMNGQGAFDRIEWACGCVTRQITSVGMRMWVYQERCDVHPVKGQITLAKEPPWWDQP